MTFDLNIRMLVQLDPIFVNLDGQGHKSKLKLKVTERDNSNSIG